MIWSQLNRTEVLRWPEYRVALDVALEEVLSTHIRRFYLLDPEKTVSTNHFRSGDALLQKHLIAENNSATIVRLSLIFNEAVNW